MILNSAPIGKYVIILRIEDEKFALQLAQMGLIPHRTIKILHKNTKTILLEADSTRIIIGSGIASTIEVN